MQAGTIDNKSRVRLATIDDLLFVHSAFPTDPPDAVFFGPDTYRFVRFVRSFLRDLTYPPHCASWILAAAAAPVDYTPPSLLGREVVLCSPISTARL